MNRRQVKSQLLSVLKQADFEVVLDFLQHHPAHRLLNALFIALSNPEEQIRWNAVRCFGRIVPAMAENDLELSRIVMRRLLWSLNDESGGIGWGAPEALAEIMCNCAVLRREYLHMLISYMRKDGEEMFQDGNYLELPLLQRGLLWGIGRLCQGHKTEILGKLFIDDITPYLSSSDRHVIGLAIWCLGFFGSQQAILLISDFLGNFDEVRLFLNSKVTAVTLAQLAEDAVKKNKTEGKCDR